MKLNNIIIKDNESTVLDVDFSTPLDGVNFNTTVIDNSGNGNNGTVNLTNDRYLEDFWLYSLPVSDIFIEKGIAHTEITLGTCTFTYGSAAISTSTDLSSVLSTLDIIRPKSGFNTYDVFGESNTTYMIQNITPTYIVTDTVYREPINYSGTIEKINTTIEFQNNEFSKQYIGTEGTVYGGWDFDLDAQVSRTFLGGFSPLFFVSDLTTWLMPARTNLNGIEAYGNNILKVSSNTSLATNVKNCKGYSIESRSANCEIDSCILAGFGDILGYLGTGLVVSGNTFIKNTVMMGFKYAVGTFFPSGILSVTTEKARFIDSVFAFQNNSTPAIVSGTYYPFQDIQNGTNQLNENSNFVKIMPVIKGENISNIGATYEFSADGPQILEYSYKINNSEYSQALPSGTKITTTVNSTGFNTIQVVAKYADGYWSDHVSESLFDTSTLEYSTLNFFVRDLITLKYTSAIINLLPQGEIWNIEDTDVFARLITALASGFARFDTKYEETQKQILAHKTVDYISEWEKEVGLPGECTVLASTVDRRREAVLAKLRTRGGNTASKQYIIDFYKSFGYDISIVEYPNCTNGVADNPWLFEIWSDYDGTEDDFARVSSGPSDTGLIFCDSPLVNWGSQLLSCIAEKVKPKHTEVRFKVNP